MVLSIFTYLKDFFSTLMEKLNIENFSVLLAGVIIGFVLCLVIYLFIILNAMRPRKEFVSKKTIPEIDEKIQKLILSSKNEYQEEYSSMPLKDKVDALKDISWTLINEIAKVYYPDSKYPIYELSLEEIIRLNHYITDRIDSLFKGKVLKAIKQIRISYILKIIDLKKKIDTNKAVKAANKTKIPGALKVLTSVLNVFNPVYWVKKFMLGTTIPATSNKLALTILDIVGEETNNVYSKSVFNVEKERNKEIEDSIYEIETMMDKEGD